MTHPIKNVLWATDFSEESKEALAYASFFAKAFKAKLIALHVVPDFAPALYEAWPEAQAELAGKIEGSKISAKAQLEHMCETQGVCAEQDRHHRRLGGQGHPEDGQERGRRPHRRRPQGRSPGTNRTSSAASPTGSCGAPACRCSSPRARTAKVGDLGKILVPTDFSARRGHRARPRLEAGQGPRLEPDVPLRHGALRPRLPADRRDVRLRCSRSSRPARRGSTRPSRSARTSSRPSTATRGSSTTPTPRASASSSCRRPCASCPASSSAARPRRSSPTAACPSSPSPGRNRHKEGTRLKKEYRPMALGFWGVGTLISLARR